MLPYVVQDFEKLVTLDYHTFRLVTCSIVLVNSRASG